jgi:general nucleoside transport system permease protein
MMTVFVFLAQTIRIAVPYLFAASGGVIAERAGVVALALEGFMLSGAFAATLGSYYSGSAWVGVACGIGGGLLFGAIYGAASIRYRADQIVTGTGVRQLVELSARRRPDDGGVG